MLKATGERVIPQFQRGELVYAEHLVRYRLAAQFAKDRRVLDAGSGEGYGTALLAAAGASSTVGIDVDEESITHARKRYGLVFEQADVADLPFDDASFDLVVCFETIEHLEDDAAALREIRRVLADEGLLIISTPNRNEYMVENEFHKREYSLEEFDALLAEQFPQRQQLYQQNWLFSSVFDAQTLARHDEENPVALNLVKVVGVQPERALYSVLICGPTPSAPEPIAALTGVFEANKMSAELSTMSAEIERLSAELKKVPELVGKLDAWIERARTAEHLRDVYEKRGDEWQERATIAERQQEAWEQRAADAERQIGQLNDAIREIEQSVSWRVTRPLRAAKRVFRA